MELSIDIKTIYGKETVYPMCENGKLLAEFKGQKTFTEADIKLLKKLGYSFRIYSKYSHLAIKLGATQPFIGVR